MTYHKSRLVLILLALLALHCTGCSRLVKVKGNVVFEDGSPLTSGEVLFESGNYVGHGRLNSEGAFSMSAASDGSGIPPGHYRVSIVNTEKSDVALVAGANPVFTPQVDPKYNNPNTSGLSFEIKKPMSPITITVEPFKGKVKRYSRPKP